MTIGPTLVASPRIMTRHETGKGYKKIRYMIYNLYLTIKIKRTFKKQDVIIRARTVKFQNNALGTKLVKMAEKSYF